MLRARVVVFVCCLGLVGLAGCSSSKPTSVAVAPTTTSTTVDLLNNLQLTISDQVPAGFIEEPLGTDGEGPLDLAGTAQSINPMHIAAVEMILQQYNFVRGYQRVWVDQATGKSLVIRVQLMGSAFQAMEYYNVQSDADRLGGQSKKFLTPTLDLASGFTSSFTDKNGARSGQFVDLARGPLFFHISLVGARGSVSQADIVTMAQSQSTESAAQGYTSGS